MIAGAFCDFSWLKDALTSIVVGFGALSSWEITSVGKDLVGVGTDPSDDCSMLLFV